ncbi:MAG: MotA/TolQ/ExbB proton channel family protein [Treponema sp.]|jgi:chemotaxis protein MotA|nr:MotA/TolQ/ExbB proton channel family protein [Treponema sp.]
MDLGTIVGLVGTMAALVFAVVSAGGSLLGILDLPSFVLVIIGSWFALMIAYSLPDALGIFSLFGKTFNVPTFNEQGIIQKMVAFSEKARREGLLALEDELEDLDDEFMKKGLRLVVDGTDAAVIRDLMELELSQMQARHANKIGLVNMWVVLSPGLGMLGTVVGLVNMLSNLDDKASIGPNMALALITTLYGSVFANQIFAPFSCKLGLQDAKETMVREMIIEGVLSIQAGDNTRILAQKLLAYLNPITRRSLEAEMLKD